jgi:hypothetical protein
MRLHLHAVTVAVAALASVSTSAAGQRGMRGGSRDEFKPFRAQRFGAEGVGQVP